MSQPEADVFTQAQDFIRSKQLPKAQRLLVDYIKQNPQSEQAWYLLSTAVDDPRKQIECLQRVLRINPANTEAQVRLMKVMSASTTPPTPAPEVKSSAASSMSGREPASYAESSSSSSVATPAPQVEARPIKPAPVGAAKPANPPAPSIDTELSGLRSKMKFVKPRKQRKRARRIIILLLLILLAASLGGYFLLNNFLQAGNPPAASEPGAIVIVPTNTLAPTDTPTVTPTPSITPTRYPPTWTPTPAPTAPPTPTPTPLPALDPAVQTALLRLRDQIADVRGLPKQGEVSTALIPPERLEVVLRSLLDIQQRQPILMKEARALAALGLIRPGYDLSRYTVNRFADNAGGLYIPWQNVIDVAGSKLDGPGSLVYVHQTAHRLLNQKFDFGQMNLYPACTDAEQRCQAIEALIEGDAALVTDQWLKTSGSKNYQAAVPDYQALAPAAPEVSTPSFVARDTAFRHEQGKAFVEALFSKGGWSAVNQAYENLPISTEQILHPDKYMAGEQPIQLQPVSLTNVLSGSWQLIANDALGEWRTYLLLAAGVDEAARLSDDTARQAAAGWGGDHYQAYYDPQSDQTALAVQWAWDTPQDAAEFQQAMSAYLDLRFRGAKLPSSDKSCWSANRQATCLYTTDKGTLWILASELGLVEQVQQAYPDFK